MRAPIVKHKGYDPLGDCGKGKCAICAKNNAGLFASHKITSTEFTSDAVTPFVGRFGYPNINVGILAPPVQEQDSWMFDAPRYWAYKNMSIPEIVNFRSSLINSQTTVNIKQRDKFLAMSQEVAMSSQPTDIDISLHKKPYYQLQLDSRLAPQGPTAQIDRAKLTSNPKIHTKVEKVFGDTDLKAQDALTYLYDNKFDETQLTRLLSVGSVGVGKNRKLVPTRWSITATDSNVGNHLVSQLKDFAQHDYAVFEGDYQGNYFVILVMPDVWSYELFETYTGTPERFTTDYEPFDGRKTYAEQTAGGFYACRLPITEYCCAHKRQGSVIALRFITDEYTMPLGVHVVRETTRKAMNTRPMTFSSRDLLINYVVQVCKKKFGVDATLYLRQSKILKERKEQSKLKQFF